jgi:dTDP-4-dehydrorhamnose 3,5-epimerase-like enzyme
MPVVVEKLRAARDDRGVVFEPLTAAELHEQRNVHVVVTDPGHVRGNHYHRIGTEVSSVLGPARVSYREDSSITTLDVPVGETWRFVFPPRIVHAFKNTGDTPMIIVSFNTISHDPHNADTVREVILQ